MRITQWVPSSGSPRWPCVISWLNTVIPANTERTFRYTPPGSFEVEWNFVIKEFLEGKDDYLFSTHDDVIYDPQTFIRLLSWDKPLVSALVFMRTNPVVPHIWRAYDEQGPTLAFRLRDTRDWFYSHKDYIRFGPFVMDPRPEDALANVDFTSTACTLIHRDVLAAMETPWFKWHKDANDRPAGGEDWYFHTKAKEAGFQGYVDRSCVAGHLIGDQPTSSAEFIAWDSVSVFQATGEPELEKAPS